MGARLTKDDAWEKLVDKSGNGHDGKEADGFLGDGWVAVHGVEEGDVGQYAGVVDLGGAHKDVAKEAGKAVADHLRGEQEEYAPASANLAVVVELEGRERAEAVRGVALEVSGRIETGAPWTTWARLTLPQ